MNKVAKVFVLVLLVSSVLFVGFGTVQGQDSFSSGVKNSINSQPDFTIRKAESVTENWHLDNITWENHTTYYEIWSLDNSDNKDRLLENILSNRLEDYLITENKLYVQHQEPADPVYLYDVDVVDKTFSGDRLADSVNLTLKIRPTNISIKLVDFLETAINNMKNDTWSGSDAVNHFKNKFNEYFYFEDRNIETVEEIISIYKDLARVPISASRGSVDVNNFDILSDDTQTVIDSLTPPVDLSPIEVTMFRWIQSGESHEFNLNVGLESVNKGFNLFEGKLGRNSITWSVSSQSDWEGGSFSSVRALDGSLKLGEVLDDFNDGDLTEYGGDTSYFNTTSGPVYEGSYALTSDGGDTPRLIADDSVTVSQGDVFHFWAYNEGKVVFSALDESGWSNFTGYYARLDSNNDRLLITRVDGDSNVDQVAEKTGVSMGADTWFEGRVDWDSDGSILFEVYDSNGNFVDSVSGTDTNYTSGGIGAEQYIPVNIDYLWRETSSGIYSSIIWDSGASTEQQIDTFTTNSTVGASENVLVRIGVDTNDDGTIDEWSHTSGNGVSLSDGTNNLDDTDFGISPGYRYSVEYYMETADITHSPGVDNYDLTVENWGVSVSSKRSERVKFEQADLIGNLENMGDATSVDVKFQYRENGTSTWDNSPIQTLSSVGEFSDTITGLNTGTLYEWRSWADNGTHTDVGGVKTFETGVYFEAENDEEWWYEAEWGLENDVRTTIDNGSLELTAQDVDFWLPFDNTNNLQDLTSNNKDIDTNNGIQWVTGKFEQAGEYESDEELRMDSAPTSSDRCRIVWVKAGDLTQGSKNYHYIYDHGQYSSTTQNLGLFFDISVDSWKWRSPSDDYLTVSDSGYQGSWRCLVINIDGDGTLELKVYDESLNLVGSDSATGYDSSYAGANMQMGTSMNEPRDWFGLIDTFRSFNRTLSNDEILRQLEQSYLVSDIKEGIFHSRKWDSRSDVKQRFENLQYSVDMAPGEGLYWNVSAYDNEGLLLENSGWINDADGALTPTEVGEELQGQEFSFKTRLETDNTTHSPDINSFDFNVENAGFIASTGPADNVGITHADIVGRIEKMETAVSTDVKIQYRPENAEGWENTVTKNTSSPDNLVFSVTTLEENTRYNYRVWADNGSVVDVGNTKSLETEPVSWSVSSQSDFENGSFTDVFAENGSIELGNFDGFEDGDIAEWSENTDSYGVQSSTVKNGSYALYRTAADGSYRSIARGSTSSGDKYIVEGYIRDTDGYAGLFIEGDHSSGQGVDYQIYIFPSSGSDFYIRNPNNNVAAESDSGVSHDTWYWLKVIRDSSSGSLDAEIYDSKGGSLIDSLSITSTIRTSGDFGIKTYRACYHDDFIWKTQTIGTWTSQIWPSGATSPTKFDRIEYSASIGSGENVLWNVNAYDADNNFLENSGYVLDEDGVLKSSELPSDLEGKNFSVDVKLQTDNIENSPSLDSYYIFVDHDGLDVDTLNSENVGYNVSDFRGELVDIGDAASADVSVQYRKKGQAHWQETVTKSLSSPDNFSISTSGLEADTKYEWRAFVDNGSLEKAGQVKTLNTLDSTWTVSSENEWFDNASSEVDVRTTIDNGSLKLLGEDMDGYWPMDEGSGSTIYDESSSGVDGSFVNSPTWASGKFDDAVQFDKTDSDYINLGDQTDWGFEGSGYFSVGAWVKIKSGVSSGNLGVISNRGSNNNTFAFRIDLDSDSLYFAFDDGTGTNSSNVGDLTAIDVHSWHHYMIVYDKDTSNTAKLYINGSLDESWTPQSGTNQNTGNDVHIGDDKGSYMDGYIDSSIVTNNSLSSDQVSRIANRTKPTSFDSETIESGTWTSKIWETGAETTQTVDNLSYSTTVESGENLYWNVSSYDADNNLLENSGWVRDNDGVLTALEMGKELNGINFSVDAKLETDNTVHSPTVDNFTLKISKTLQVFRPENLEPKGTITKTSPVDLSAYVEDPQGDSMNVHFYNDSGGLIDNVWTDNGTTATVSWSKTFNSGKNYTYEVEAIDNKGNASDSNFETFSTQYIHVENLNTYDSAGNPEDVFGIGDNVTIKFEAKDNRGDTYIDKSFLTITDPDGAKRLDRSPPLEFLDRFPNEDNWDDQTANHWETGDYHGSTDPEYACGPNVGSSAYGDITLVKESSVENRENISITTEAMIEYETEDHPAIIFRYEDSNNYCRAYFSDYYSVAGIEVISNGQTYAESVSFFPNVDTWYKMEVIVEGGQATLYIDGKKMVTNNEVPVTSGRIGLYADAGYTYFDNYEVGYGGGSIETNITNGYRYRYDYIIPDNLEIVGLWDINPESRSTDGHTVGISDTITVAENAPVVENVGILDNTINVREEFEAGENVVIRSDVIDSSGRATIENAKITFVNPAGETKVDNVQMNQYKEINYGYRYQYSYIIPKEDNSEGTWSVTVHSDDNEGFSSSENNTFYDNIPNPSIEFQTKNESLENRDLFDLSENLVVRADVTDPDGRDNITSTEVTIWNQDDQKVVDSSAMSDIGNITEGNVYEYIYSFPRRKENFGLWKVQVYSTDGTYTDTSSKNFKLEWNYLDYEYRKAVNLSEKMGRDHTNEEAGFKLSVSDTKLDNAGGIRIADDRGNEVPFRVWKKSHSGGTRTVYVNFIENIEANQDKKYWVYYDNDTTGKTYSDFENKANRTWEEVGFKKWYNTENSGQVTYSKAVDVGDVDADAEEEIVVVGQTDNGNDITNGFIRVYEPSFNSPDNYTLTLEQDKVWTTENSTFTYSVHLKELNDDGNEEIVTGGITSIEGGTGDKAELVVWDADGELTRLAENIWTDGGESGVFGVNISDIDDDGNYEIMSAGYSDGENLAQLKVFEYSDSTLTETDSATFGITSSNPSRWYRVVPCDSENRIAVSGVSRDSGGVLQGILGLYSFDGTTLTENYTENFQKGGSVTEYFGMSHGDVDQDGTDELAIGGNWYDGTRDRAMIRIYTCHQDGLVLENWFDWYIKGRGSALTTIISDSDKDSITELNTAGFAKDEVRDRGQYRQFLWDNSDNTRVDEYNELWKENDSLRAGDFSDAAVLEDLNEDGVVEMIDVGRYKLTPPTATYVKIQSIGGVTDSLGSEQVLTSTPQTTSVSPSLTVIDNNIDNPGSGAENSVDINLTVSDSRDAYILNPMDLSIRDNSGSIVLDNFTVTDNELLNNTSLKFTYQYTPSGLSSLGTMDIQGIITNQFTNENRVGFGGSGKEKFAVADSEIDNMDPTITTVDRKDDGDLFESQDNVNIVLDISSVGYPVRPSNVYFSVRDNADNVDVSNANVSSLTERGKYASRFIYNYNPSNDLENLGEFDVEINPVWNLDAPGETFSGRGNSIIKVDDRFTTIDAPNTVRKGEEITLTGDVSGISTPVSLDNVLVQDESSGIVQANFGTDNWSVTYEVTGGKGSTQTVNVEVLDLGSSLDGENTVTYSVENAPVVENLVAENIGENSADIGADVYSPQGRDIQWMAFYNNSNDNLIDNVVATKSSPASYSTTWNDLEAGNEYGFYAKAADNTGYVSLKSDVKIFETVRAKVYPPENLEPSGMQADPVTLTADISNIDADVATVYFVHDNDGIEGPSDFDDTIGTDTVTGNGTASIVWDNLGDGKTYDFYCYAVDEEGTSGYSSVQSFYINGLPTVYPYITPLNTSNLSGLWPLNQEGPDTEALDVAEPYNNAKMGPELSDRFVSGYRDEAIRFRAENVAIVSDNASLDISNSISIGAYVNFKGEVGPSDVIAGKENSYYISRLDNGSLRFGLKDTGGSWNTVVTEKNIPLYGTVFIGGYYDGSEMVARVGENTSSKSVSITIQTNDSPFTIGGFQSDNKIKAMVDDVNLWSTNENLVAIKDNLYGPFNTNNDMTVLAGIYDKEGNEPSIDNYQWYEENTITENMEQITGQTSKTLPSTETETFKTYQCLLEFKDNMGSDNTFTERVAVPNSPPNLRDVSPDGVTFNSYDNVVVNLSGKLREYDGDNVSIDFYVNKEFVGRLEGLYSGETFGLPYEAEPGDNYDWYMVAHDEYWDENTYDIGKYVGIREPYEFEVTKLEQPENLIIDVDVPSYVERGKTYVGTVVASGPWSDLRIKSVSGGVWVDEWIRIRENKFAFEFTVPEDASMPDNGRVFSVKAVTNHGTNYGHDYFNLLEGSIYLDIPQFVENGKSYTGSLEISGPWDDLSIESISGGLWDSGFDITSQTEADISFSVPADEENGIYDYGVTVETNHDTLTDSEKVYIKPLPGLNVISDVPEKVIENETVTGTVKATGPWDDIYLDNVSGGIVDHDWGTSFSRVSDSKFSMEFTVPKDIEWTNYTFKAKGETNHGTDYGSDDFQVTHPPYDMDISLNITGQAEQCNSYTGSVDIDGFEELVIEDIKFSIGTTNSGYGYYSGWWIKGTPTGSKGDWKEQVNKDNRFNYSLAFLCPPKAEQVMDYGDEPGSPNDRHSAYVTIETNYGTLSKWNLFEVDKQEIYYDVYGENEISPTLASGTEDITTSVAIENIPPCGKNVLKERMGWFRKTYSSQIIPKHREDPHDDEEDTWNWENMSITDNTLPSDNTRPGGIYRYTIDLNENVGWLPDTSGYYLAWHGWMNRKEFSRKVSVIGPPNIPSASKSDTKDNNPEIFGTVSDNNGDDVTAYFYDNSDDSLIGTSTATETGISGYPKKDTENIIWSGLQRGESYSYYVEAEDNTGRSADNSSNVATFYITEMIVENLSPDNHIYDNQVTLSADVVHLDKETVDVVFYRDNDSVSGPSENDYHIGTDSIDYKGTAQISWSVFPDNFKEKYDWYVRVEDREGTDADDNKYASESFTVHELDASNYSPTGNILDNTPTFSVTLEHYWGQTVDVYFYEDNDATTGFSAGDDIIGSDTVAGSGTASYTWTNLNKDSFDWFVRFEDVNDNKFSDVFSVSVTDMVSDNYIPEDNTEFNAGKFSVDVSADVVHKFGNDFDAFLYAENGANDFLLGSDNISGSGTVTGTYSRLENGKSYTWYVKMSDSDDNIFSDDHSFSINAGPAIEDNFVPENGEVVSGIYTEGGGTDSNIDDDYSGASNPVKVIWERNSKDSMSVLLQAYVKDKDGDDVTVKFFDGNDNLLGSEVVSGSGYADNVYSGLEPGENYFWYISVTDPKGLTENSAKRRFETNVAPWPLDDTTPEDGEVIAPTNEVDLKLTGIYDDDDSEITVRFYDNNGDFIGSETVDNGGTATTTWGIENLGRHEWYALASDGQENTRYPVRYRDENTYYFDVDSPTEILDIETASPVNPNWPFDTVFYIRDNDGIDQIDVSRMVIKEKGKYWNKPFNKKSLYPFSWEKDIGFSEVGFFSDHIFFENSKVEKYNPGVTINKTGTGTFEMHNAVLENAFSTVNYGFSDDVDLTLTINDNTILDMADISGVGSIENRVDNSIQDKNTVEVTVDNEERIEALSTTVNVNTKGIMGAWYFTTQMENDAKVSENFDVWTRFYGDFDYEERVFDNVIKMPQTDSTLTVDAAASGYGENVKFKMTYPESKYPQKFGVSPVRGENIIWGYLASENYTVKAEDLFGYKFDNWTGDVPVDENENSRTITLPLSDKGITANYTKINTLTVEARASGYDGKIEFNLTRVGESEIIREANIEHRGSKGWELENGSYELLAGEIENYKFDRWGGDFSGSDNPITVTLSDKTAIAYYETVENVPGPQPSPPGPAPSEELDMDIRIGKLVGGRGQAISGVFKETKNFVQGDTMVVRAELTYGGEQIEAREIYMEYGDRRILMTEQEGGYYQGAITIPNDEIIGTHAVEVTASTAEGDISRSESLFIRALPAAPSPEEFPWWFKYLAIGLIIPTILMIPESEWVKTPRNWSEKAKPGEWTFTKGTIILLALSAIGALAIGLISGVVNIGFALYSGLAIFVGTAIVTELRDDDEPLAVIGITTEYGERLVLSGIMFSISFVYLISVGLGAVGLAIYPMAFHMAMLSIAGVLTSVALTGISIPIIEEVSVKGVITPLIAERFGIYRSTIGTGVIFGLLHVLFGGGIGIFITAFIFGTVTAYMTLRNQSLLFAGAAHITYNMVVVLIALGLL